jgi:hypothetical protein
MLIFVSFDVSYRKVSMKKLSGIFPCQCRRLAIKLVREGMNGSIDIGDYY